MDKHQALQLLAQAAAAYRGTLQEHNQLQQAVKVLMTELSPKKDKPEVKEQDGPSSKDK